MSSPQDRMSTIPVEYPYVPPDGRDHPLLEDYELGPIAIEDTSEGSAYQVWHLTYVGTEFILTPETTGSPVVVLNATNVTQCTFAFDQNANIAISYMASGTAFLYWFDTLVQQYITSSNVGIISPALTLDDKRAIQSNKSDIMLYYTKAAGGGTHNLYTRRQRDRYSIERLEKTNVWPYIWKLGMNQGFRVQLMNSTETQS